MATKEEIEDLFNRLNSKIDKNHNESNEKYAELRNEMKSVNEFMIQLVKNIDKRLDDRDVMTDNKLKLFREGSNEIISDKIRESEERS